MKQADAAFRAGRYEDALAAFHEARSIRPYNVYPKVKIQDLQALIKKQDEERVGQTPVVPPPADPPGPAVVATPSPQETPEPPLNTPHYEHHEIGFNYRLSNLLADPPEASAPPRLLAMALIV